MIPLTPRSGSFARTFHDVVSLTLILYCFGWGEGVLAATAHRPFAVFNVTVDLDIEDGEFEVMATFTLGAGNNGIDLSAETVNLQVTGGAAGFSVTIPPGSFKKDRSGQFAFQGTVDKVRLQALVRPLRTGAFDFEIEGDRVKLEGVANPITVSLTVGDDSGSRSVRAKIE